MPERNSGGRALWASGANGMPLNSRLAIMARSAFARWPRLRQRLKSIHHRQVARKERADIERNFPGTRLVAYPPGRLSELAKSGFRSQAGQDHYLASEGLVPERDGRFIDIGCNQPILASNSYYFEASCGYSGLAVDPLGDYAESWRQHRPRSQFVQAFVSNRTEAIAFTEVAGDEGWETMLSGASDALELSGKNVQTRSRMVQPVRLGRLLAEQHMAFDVDVLFLDVEGHERQVLESADWSAPGPAVLVIENTGDTARQNSLRHYVEGLGYRFHARLGIFDDVYLRNPAA